MSLSALAQLVALSALWGASFLFIRIASPQLGPAVLAGLRVGLATIALAALMWLLKERWPRTAWLKMALIAMTAVAMPFILFSWAGLHLPSTYSALINTSYVMFGCLFGAWLKLDKLTGKKLLGCVLGMLGISLIVQLGPLAMNALTWLACAACLLAAACYGLATPLTKLALSDMEPLPLALYTHLGSFVLLLPIMLPALPQAKFSVEALSIVALLGIVTSGLAYWWNLRVMRHISSTAAMSPAFMIPIFGVLWGHVFLGEAVSLKMLAGAALALIAVALISDLKLSVRSDASTKPATPPAS